MYFFQQKLYKRPFLPRIVVYVCFLISPKIYILASKQGASNEYAQRMFFVVVFFFFFFFFFVVVFFFVVFVFT